MSALRRASSFLSLAGLGVVIACSSSSSPGGDGGTSSGCSCDLSYNGATRTISCGSDTCLNGVSFTCGKSADVTQGGACTGTGSDAGTGSDSGSKTYQPGQCSQTTTGTVITVSGQCEYCVETNCCNELKACTAGADCKQFDQCDLACVVSASSGGGNYQTCVAACTPVSGKTSRQALYDCRASNCSTLCK